MKMEKYFQKFIDQGFDDLEAIAGVTTEHLQEMGALPGHIVKILGRATLLAQKYPGTQLITFEVVCFLSAHLQYQVSQFITLSY